MNIIFLDKSFSDCPIEVDDDIMQFTEFKFMNIDWGHCSHIKHRRFDVGI